MIYADGSPCPKGLNRWGFNPKKRLGPQIAAAAAQMVYIFGGPSAALLMVDRYPPLVANQTMYISGLMCIAVGIVAGLALPLNRVELSRISPVNRCIYRAGFGLAFSGWLLGLGGIANGYGTQIFMRDVPVVAKHETLQRDPARRAHYISVRPWAGLRRVQDIDAPLSAYNSLSVPITTIHTPSATLEAMPDTATARLVLGKGRFGLDWLKSVEVPSLASAQITSKSSA